MTNSYPAHPSNHRRYYILMTTLVVGAILVLLLLNDSGTNGLFTGASVGVKDDSTATASRGTSTSGKAVQGKGIDFKLNFDSVPTINENTQADSIKLTFDNTNSKITVNNEELELSGVDKVEMEISGFKGKISFDELSLSLTGEGDKMIVNGMEISTRGKLKISFGNLDYKTLDIFNTQIASLDFKEGNGKLELGDKMGYNLAYEKMKAKSFSGDLSIGSAKDSLLLMEGKLGSISLTGDFDLTVG